MRAVVYRKDLAEFRLEDIPDPPSSLNPDEVRIRVLYTGICGSDLFLVKAGRLPDGAVLGHEISGRVEAFGKNVTAIEPGRNVIVRPMGCGRCKACLNGEENICPERESIGLGGRNGGFAPVIVVPEAMAIPVPEGLDPEHAALAEPLATALHAVEVGEVKPDDTVLVFGVGGIGLCCLSVLKALGIYNILAADIDPAKRSLAETFGIAGALDPMDKDFEEIVRSRTGGTGPSVVMECAGRVETVEQGLKIAVVGGKVIVVGLAQGAFPLAPALVMLKQLRLQGSWANTQAECRRCMELMAQGKIEAEKLIGERIALEALPERFSRLLKGEGSKGKIVVQIS